MIQKTFYFYTSISIRTGLAVIALLAAALRANVAHAGVIQSTVDYFKQFHVGLDLSTYQSSLHLRYSTDSDKANDASCSQEGSTNHCHLDIADESNRGHDYGIFIQQPFKRKGWIHYDFDLGGSLRYLSGRVRDSDLKGEHPFDKISYGYAMIEMRPYVQLGLTPPNWLPDLLFSLGPAAYYAYGKFAVDDEDYWTKGLGAIGRSSITAFFSFFEMELVVWRFGTNGALSLFSSQLVNRPAVGAGSMVPANAGDIRIKEAWISRQMHGFKLLLGKL
jgi:hypothetical protein